MKGFQRKDFFQWLSECGIDTQQVVDECKKHPDVFMGFDYEVTDESLSTLPMQVMFHAKYVSESQLLKMQDVTVTYINKDKDGNKKPGPPHHAVQLVKRKDGSFVAKMDAEIQGHPFHGYPRNAPCFCGSGKKYKKCHFLEIPAYCLNKDYKNLKAYFDMMIQKLETLNHEQFNEYCRSLYQATNSGKPSGESMRGVQDEKVSGVPDKQAGDVQQSV